MSEQTVFKALADPTRRKILSFLNDGSANAGQIAEQFEISKASISHHLSLLKNADLVAAQRQGQNIVYSINTSVLEDVTRVILDIAGKPSETEGVVHE